MRLFQIIVNRDDTIRLAVVDVVKETPQFYFITPKDRELKWNDPRREERDAFGYSDRVSKERAFISERSALEFYIAKRNRDRTNARAVALQCDKQIESADRLMESLPLVNAGATPVEQGATESA